MNDQLGKTVCVVMVTWANCCEIAAFRHGDFFAIEQLVAIPR